MSKVMIAAPVISSQPRWHVGMGGSTATRTWPVSSPSKARNSAATSGFEEGNTLHLQTNHFGITIAFPLGTPLLL